MHVDQITSGNWDQADAIEAVERFYNAPAMVGDDNVVMIHRGVASSPDYGWTPAIDADLPSILAIRI